MTGIEQAIYNAGSQAKLAAILGCSQQNVGFWLKQGYCPPERIIEVEQATGVGRAQLINPKLLDLLTPASL
jgi:DNA-binding transcriptional regulator YdaS (Cro superfamily)